MLKNAPGQTFVCFAFNRLTNEPVDDQAANITCFWKKDNATPISLAGPPVFMGRGKYLFSLSQSDTNADSIKPDPRCSTSFVEVIPSELEIVPEIRTTGFGEYVVTIAVNDDVANVPIPQARITIQQTTGEIYAYGATGVLGTVVFNLPAGDFKVNVSAFGYVGVSLDDLTVGANATVVYELLTQPLTPPPLAGLCTVAFWVTDNGSPVQGALVQVELEDENPMIDRYLVSRAVHRGVTNSSGEVTLYMLRQDSFVSGGRYSVRVDDPQGKRIHDRIVTVPNQSTCYADDLVDA